MAEPFDSIPLQSAPEYTRPPDEQYTGADDEEFRRRQVINHLITERLVERLTGRGEGQETLYGVDPRVRYFAATLSNQYEYREEQQTNEEGEQIEAAGSAMKRDISPFTTGLKLKIDPSKLDGPLRITPNSAVFYKRFPTLEEQREHSDLAAVDASEDEVSEPEPEVQADGGMAAPEGPQPLVSVYERVTPDFEAIQVPESQLSAAADAGGEITESVDIGIKRAQEAFKADDRALTKPAEDATYHDQQSVKPDALTSEQSFEEYLNDTFTDTLVDPLWSAEVRIEVAQRADGMYDVTVQLVNTQGEDPATATQPDEDWQSFLFDASLTVEGPSEGFSPFESERVQEHYQYDGQIYATGRNCAANTSHNGGTTEIKTEPVPVYRQPKYVSRDTVSAPTERLADGEIEPVLNNIVREMERAHDQYQAVREEVLKTKGENAADEYDEMLAQFDEERRRFEQGLELLLDEDANDLRTAFEALNQTFTGEFEGWRLFQIVFIVMSIPDMASQAGRAGDTADHLEQCDIIFFPTGGGKTEAYLGVVTFTAFLDRLRGKEHGMTALTKFPLRLLSLQQLQRIADVLCRAEEVRRAHDEMEGDQFSVGYFVGKNNTPNKLFPEDDTNNVALAANSEKHQQKWLTIPSCPFCDEESVEVTGDTERLRIVHQCTNQSCREVERQGGETAELPVYITDEEVYRYAPTFVVSTIDKIAVVGMNRRARSLLGRFKYRCPDHGYTTEESCLADDFNSPDKHSCDNTAEDGLEQIEPTDPPSLLIQDELHLLREEFGAFDSHYETLIQKLIDEYTDGEWQLKTIAATATIEGADEQVEALYRRDPNEFPSQGPRLRQSFYAYEDPYRLGRQMIGAIPRSIGRTRAMIIVIREYAKLIQSYEDDLNQLDEAMHAVADEVVEGPLNFPEDGEARREAIARALDDYKVQIAYNISKNQSDILQRSIKGMLNRQLDAYGDPYERLRPVSLTGETDMEKVREALSQLEADDPDRPIDAVIATSMISHGVDVDRFNFISFFGMPRNTAEYIQAYSRVGRASTGSVFVLFDSIKARDRSHYARFEHYHRYQDLLVEATPLERWAEFAIECTLPGIFLGIILQYYDYHHEQEFEKRLYSLDGFREALSEGVIDYDEVLEHVLEAYDVVGADGGDSDIGARLYREAIAREFERLWNNLLEADPDIRDPREAGLKKYLGNVMEDEDKGLRGPMRSLRDIDEQIPVTHGLAEGDLKEMFSGGE